MNIKDKLVKTLYNLIIKEEQKEKLTEFPMSKKYIIDKLYDMRIKLNYHLIYCYFWYNTDNYNHWKTEISSFIKNLPRVSGTNKFPTAKQLRKWVIDNNIEEINDNIEFYVSEAISEENIKELPEYNKQNLINYLTEYWIWLSENISDGKNLSNSQVYTEVDNLINKYKEN